MITLSRKMVSTGFSTFKQMRLNLLLLSSILGALVVLAAAEKDPSLENQVNEKLLFKSEKKSFNGLKVVIVLGPLRSKSLDNNLYT